MHKHLSSFRPCFVLYSWKVCAVKMLCPFRLYHGSCHIQACLCQGRILLVESLSLTQLNGTSRRKVLDSFRTRDQGSFFLLLNPSSLRTAHLRRNVQWCHETTGGLSVIFSGANYVKRALLKSRVNRSLQLLSSSLIIMPKPGLHKAVRLQLTSDARYDRFSDSCTINHAKPDYFWIIRLWLTLVADHQTESSSKY